MLPSIAPAFRIMLSSLIVLACSAPAGAQSASDEPDRSNADGDGIQRVEVEGDQVTLWKDSGMKLDESHAETVRRNAGVMSSNETGDLRDDLRKIRVMKPTTYEALNEEERRAIDEDPFYFVTEKSREQVMGDYLIEHLRPATATPAAPGPAVTPDSWDAAETPESPEAAEAPKAPEVPAAPGKP